MMRPIKVVLLAGLAMIAGCKSDSVTNPPIPPPAPAPQATVSSATGDVGAAVAAFRASLGPSNGGTAGEQASGHREINWDGAAADRFDNTSAFPADFFNTVVAAGAVFTTNGTGFRNDSSRFASINPTYAGQFNFFSANKIFSPLGSNQFDQLFQVAGQPTPAAVRAVGIVFSDVDLPNKTTLQLFAQDGSSLGTYAAPIRSDSAGLSFVSVTFSQSIIARVRVTLGTGALGAGVNDVSDGGTADLVVLDNVIYGEPKRSP